MMGFPRHVAKSEFVRNVLLLMTGNTVAQIVVFASTPILSRMYSPEDFALFALFSNTVTVLLTVVSLRYELSVMLPESKKEASLLFVSSALLAVLFSVSTLAAFTVLRDRVSLMSSSPLIGKWLPLVSLMLLVSGISQCFISLFNRYKLYSTISRYKITQTMSTSIVSILLGFCLVRSGLIIAAVIGQIIGSVYLIVEFKRHWQSIYDGSFLFSDVRPTLAKYIDFPRFYTFTGLLDSLAVALPIFVFSAHYKAVTVGTFSFAFLSLAIPVGIITTAVSSVYFQKLSVDVYNRAAIENGFKKICLTLIAAGVFPFIILVIIAPNLFSFIWGERWLNAGVYAQILAPVLFVRFVVSPLSYILIAKNKLKIVAVWQMFYFGTTYAVLQISSRYSFDVSLSCYVINDVVCYILYLGIIYWEIRKIPGGLK